MKLPIFLVSVLYFQSLCFSTFAKSKNVQPNLLVIMTDEHNFRTLGCYRDLMTEDQAFPWGKGVAVETPNIDRLASEGALCTSFYASTPVCSPSRSSFVSGRYPQRTAVHSNDIPLDGTIVTFAEVAKQNGYRTGYAGKWHLDGEGKPQWQPKRNFGFEDNRFMFNRGHWKQFEIVNNQPRVAAFNEKGQPSYSIKGATEKNFSTDFLIQNTIDFIAEKHDEPFCYMVSLPDPHGPNTVRAPYNTMYSDVSFQKPATSKNLPSNLPSWAKPAKRTIDNKGMSQYWGMVKCIDDQIGRLLTFLEETNQLDNTIVVFTSDHGDLLGEHGKDNKGNIFEGSARVPFVIRYPKKIKKNFVIDDALSTVDFMPTILSLMDLDLSGHEDGQDASFLFDGEKKTKGFESTVVVRGTGKGGATGGSTNGSKGKNWIASVDERYKLILSENEGDQPWLIDLKRDPNELINYYNDSKLTKVRKQLAQRMKDYGTKYNDARVLSESIQKQLSEIL